MMCPNNLFEVLKPKSQPGCIMRACTGFLGSIALLGRLYSVHV